MDGLRTALSWEIQAFQSSVDAFDEIAAQRLAVTRTDMRCLEILLRDGAASAGAIGQAVGLTSGGVTAMLTRLERQGYVRRATDPADRRRVTVEVTEQARRLTDELYGPIVHDGFELLDKYGAAELTLLTDFLTATRELYERHLTRVRATPTPLARPRSVAPSVDLAVGPPETSH